MRNHLDNAVEPDLRLICQRVVHSLCERFGWGLVGKDELLEQVLGSVQSGAAPSEVERLAKHLYTTVLYQACRQTQDVHRRECGYAELFRHLYRAAYNRWPELVEDATQRALMLVYEQIDHCRHPGAFLAFALGKLRHAIQQERRARGEELALDEMGQGFGVSHLHFAQAQAAQPNGGAATDPTVVSPSWGGEELSRALLDAITRLPQEPMQKAILLKFFGGFSDAEIGARLGITAGHVRVLRHRGLAQLRQDERLREYSEQGGERVTGCNT